MTNNDKWPLNVFILVLVCVALRFAILSHIQESDAFIIDWVTSHQ
jgi:hypothetical protein